MFFSQFYKSQNIEYRECRWNVEKQCTNYNEHKINKLINRLTSKFYFSEDILMEEIDINDLKNTLDNGKTLIIQEN